MRVLFSLQNVLKKSGKELSPEQLDRIMATEQTNTPLYLRLVLSVCGGSERCQRMEASGGVERAKEGRGSEIGRRG